MSDIRTILAKLQTGELSLEQAEIALKTQPFEDLQFAMVDHHRRIRQGAPEVIYGAGKTPQQCRAISQSLLAGGADNILITRVGRETYEAVRDLHENTVFYETCRMVVVHRVERVEHAGVIAVCAAGTSDLYCAEEAAVTCEVMGNRVERIYDCGVAGLHRLLANLPRIVGANVVIAVAGMEGALPSVIGGLVDAPVIAVPTSVGYGASLGGMAALLAMLNSCASGISVVNIDNGFGAGYTASLINNRRAAPES